MLDFIMTASGWTNLSKKTGGSSQEAVESAPVDCAKTLTDTSRMTSWNVVNKPGQLLAVQRPREVDLFTAQRQEDLPRIPPS
jgi:hypothetical protein